MSQPFKHEETLFNEALAKPASDRAAFLDQACGDDLEMRARVATLLAAHDSPETALGSPVVGLANHQDERLGTRIGHYKLLQKIGEGGCGTVYLAEQKEPVHRRVALKVRPEAGSVPPARHRGSGISCESALSLRCR